MDAQAWDERYAGTELVWTAGPNRWVVELVQDLPPGRALDLAAGEGRNAIWLAEHGWQVDALDFSTVAVHRMEQLADERLDVGRDRLRSWVGDATVPFPEADEGGYDLVLTCYLHLPEDAFRQVMESALRALAPGGRLLVIGHALTNLERGHGGPQDAAVLYEPEDVVDVLALRPADVVVDVELAEHRHRPVEDAGRDAVDTVVLAVRRDG